jgi:hypothetical protein
LTKETESYFSILKDYFGPLVRYSSKKGYSGLLESVDAVAQIYTPQMVTPIMTSLSEELSKLNWKAQTEELDKIGGVRSSYLGNAYMYLNEDNKTFDFLKKTALYSDTTIISDPLISELLTWQQRKTGEVKSFQIIAQYALQLLAIEELFDSDINPPICYLAPSSVLTLKERNMEEATQNIIEEHIVPFYGSALFGRDFASSDELFEFLGKFKSFNEFLITVQSSEIPLINPDGTLVNENKCRSIKEYYEDKYCRDLSLPDALFAIIRGRFSMAAYDLIVNSRFTSNFATDFKGVWNSLLWLLEKDNEFLSKTVGKVPFSKDMMILNTFREEPLKWLGDVPLDKIKKLRERGELQEIRDILGKNVREIENVNDEEFHEVGKQVTYSLNEAFKRHSSKTKDLDDKYKTMYRIDAPSLVVTGILALTSAVYPPLAYIAGVTGAVTGGTTALDIVKKYFEKREELKALQRKPVAMLFDVYKKSLGSG